MKLHFIPIFEYDETIDSKRVLGYPKNELPLIPSLIQVYQIVDGNWNKLRGKQWRECEPPYFFCDVPKICISKFRKPTIEKINKMDIQTAMKYAQKDEKMQAEINEFVKNYLKKEFY